MLNRFTVFLLIGCAFLICTHSANAAIISQAGPNPIPINQTSTTDNVQVLLATLAERTSDIVVVNPTEGRKNFNIDNFLTAADYLAWTITVPTGANYQVTALINANSGQHLSFNGDSVNITFTGTGIDVIGPMSSADGSANVKLDGAQVSTMTAVYSGTYTPQQHYWGIRNQTPGPHTLTLTKTGGAFLQLDAVTVWP